MTVPEAALRLHMLGFNPVPLEPGGKRPLDGDWQKCRDLHPLILSSLFASRPRCNVGILTGGGLIVLDLDEKPATGVSGGVSLSQLQATLGVLPTTVTAVTPSGGRHLYFKVPPGARIRNSVSKLAPGVDVRGEGGQVVAPPSRLADGRVYDWRGLCAPGTYEVAALPARWLARLVELQAEPAPVSRPAGGERLVTTAARAVAKYRATAYLAAMPPAVSGQGGHARTFDAACRAVERCLTREDALAALADYNARCQPPWEPWELEHKLDDALRKYALGSAVDRASGPRVTPRQ